MTRHPRRLASPLVHATLALALAATGAGTGIQRPLAAEPLPSPLTSAAHPGNSYAADIQRLRENARHDPALQAQVKTILDDARHLIATTPIARRARTYAELANPAPPDTTQRMGSIDGRTPAILEADPAKGELFALAMSDTGATGILARELPLFAAAWLLTDDDLFLKRIREQLAEVVTWIPLQRPGWTLYTPKNNLPAGGDGVWLSTGQGLTALAQTLALLPPRALDPALVSGIHDIMRAENRRIVKDWRERRPWYVRNQAVGSNQWVVPAAGLLASAATLLPGPDAGTAATDAETRRAWNLGITSLQQSLDSYGDEGAVSEGFGYGSYWTGNYLYLAARAAADAGDTRLATHPFLKNYPRWLTQNFQPGQNVINSFDNFGGQRGKYHTLTDTFTRQAALSRDPELAWLLRHQIKYVARDLYGLLILSRPPADEKEPPLWGSYERARSVNWRSAWADDASGVWVRGADPRDGHAHHDHGHVNFIAHGKIVLMEAGTPGYSEPDKRDLYDSVVGHNVLQTGDEKFPEKRHEAPITITKLDATGGDLTVEPGAGYANVKRWTRRVRWNADRIDITDTLSLVAPDTILLRWHLGSENPLAIAPDPGAPAGEKFTATLPAGRLEFPGWIGNLSDNSIWTPPETDTVETPSVTISVEASHPVRVTQDKAVDHTIKFRRWKHLHTLLQVQADLAADQEITIRSSFESPARK
jgi:hypothetical protein